jgi:multiple sugar transport system permease protein
MSNPVAPTASAAGPLTPVFPSGGPTATVPRLNALDQRKKVQRRVISVLKHLFLIAIAITMIYPLLWMVASAFRPSDVIFRELGVIPTEIDLSNFQHGWNAFRTPFSRFFINTFIIALGAVVGNLFSCSLAAYAFARQRFRGRNLMFAVMLMTVMLPGHVVLIPQYIIFSRLGLVNTFIPLILPKFLAVDAFYTFLMVQFIRGLPRELDESAVIDGAGPFRIFSRIILPLMVPALATTAIFTFIGTWNDFFSQLIYLTKQDQWTVSLALRGFIDTESGSSYGSMFAMSLLAVAPLFIVFLFGQKYLVKGIATTGFK